MCLFFSFSLNSVLSSSSPFLSISDQPTRCPTSFECEYGARQVVPKHSPPPPVSSLLPSPSRLLKKKEGTFYYRNISGDEFIFITVLNKFQKLAAGENYSHYSFILIVRVIILGQMVSSSQILLANKACPRRMPQILVHFEISRLPGGLSHFVDSNSIS